KNLFIVDGSIFVTSAAVNPTTTIQALALRTADHIKRHRVPAGQEGGRRHG
ncbi:MAG TPA: GMC oxidoreductase, partial [Chloroflexota bacterium]|nr:GMC oxidoreductase [Chloroflexota bacterium]